MKIALVALVLALSLIETEAYWGYGYGGLYGGGYGGLYGGLYSGLYGGLYGGYGLNYWGRRSADEKVPEQILNRTECAYVVESGLISCHGPSGIVECETQLTWKQPIDFQLYGIGLFEEGKFMSEETETEYRFRIFPRKLDNSGWERGTYSENGVETFASLYFSESAGYEGLRVKDSKCFFKLATLMNKSARKELSTISGESKPVTIFGDMIIANDEEMMHDEEMMMNDEEEEITEKRHVKVTEDFEEFKKRAEGEWDLIERNTETLVTELNHLKSELSTLKADLYRDAQSSAEDRPKKASWTQ
jgi:chaperonin cofactor prefoldin